MTLLTPRGARWAHCEPRDSRGQRRRASTASMTHPRSAAQRESEAIAAEKRRRRAREHAFFTEQRELAAVCNSFGSLFKRGAPGKMHWFKPVLEGAEEKDRERINEERSDDPDGLVAKWGRRNRPHASVSSVKQENLRRVRSTELMQKHDLLVRSDSVKTLGIASLLDIPRNGQVSPYFRRNQDKKANSKVTANNGLEEDIETDTRRTTWGSEQLLSIHV